MKFAVKMKKILTRTVIVEAGSYRDAADKVIDAYYDDDLELCEDNSSVDLVLENDTANYIEIFGDEFYGMDVTEGLE